MRFAALARLVCLVAVASGLSLCWYRMASTEPADQGGITDRSEHGGRNAGNDAVSVEPTPMTPGTWVTPGDLYNQPYGNTAVALPREFRDRADVLAWAERDVVYGYPLAFCQGSWCAILLDVGTSGVNAWNGLFFENAPSAKGDPKPWKLRWVCYRCVWGATAREWPDCAWVEADRQTFVIATQTGKKLTVTRFPRPIVSQH